MKADTSRTTFDPRKHYQGVYLQQGRVQIDADWNEQVALTAHRLRRVARDIVGPAGVPRVAAGFACAPTADGLDLTITPGRLHVAGQVCENETPVTLKSQPHWPPEGPLVITEAESLPLADIPNGLYLVELDVWSRTVTALEDPALLEPALGGADTTFRSQLIWQARLVAVAPQSGGYQCGDPLPAWLRARRASTGTLTADTTKAPETLDDCELSATAGYRRLENQHYRVEIHTAGADGTATFKWSRENGSIVVPWKDRNGQRLSMGSAAGDLHRRFASGDTIELLSDTHILQGMPGVILTVEGVADDQLTVAEAPAQIPDPGSFGPHPRIRRWEGGPPQPVVAGSPMPLEAGIQITFGAGNFRSGDYWSIPARTGGAGLLWPKNAVDEQMELPPAGIAHAYAPLALVVASGGKLTMAGDCRTVFPPLTDIRADDVSFDNNNCGNDMQKADTVQEAIEVLCQRPTGGGGAAQTCDIHVNPREAIPLEERIKKLVDAGHQQLCLCLAPGEHITKSPLHISTENDGLHTLHLRGCGPASRLSIQKPLALDLKSLRIEGLALRPTAEAGPIILAGEGTIQLVENSVSGTLEKAAPLVIIEASGDILLSGNRLRPTSTDRNRMLKELFPQSILEVNMDTAAFRNRRRFRRAAALAAARLTSRTR
ncbi:MAG: DUF6519 domain-containing protein, partial [Desulfosarcinaceae bacterium]|nr:DUF6519 domain-containing protein [Desulfosarcinaceae bacterium]